MNTYINIPIYPQDTEMSLVRSQVRAKLKTTHGDKAPVEFLKIQIVPQFATSHDCQANF